MDMAQTDPYPLASADVVDTYVRLFMTQVMRAERVRLAEQVSRQCRPQMNVLRAVESMNAMPPNPVPPPRPISEPETNV